MEFSIVKSIDARPLSIFIRSVTKDIVGASDEYRKEELKNFTHQKTLELIKNKNTIFIVAKNNKKIIGHCHGIIFAGTCWIEGLGVSKIERKKGVALELLKRMQIEVKKKKVHLLWANAMKTNKPSRAISKKFGFEELTTLTNHFN